MPFSFIASLEKNIYCARPRGQALSCGYWEEGSLEFARNVLGLLVSFFPVGSTFYQAYPVGSSSLLLVLGRFVHVFLPGWALLTELAQHTALQTKHRGWLGADDGCQSARLPFSCPMGTPGILLSIIAVSLERMVWFWYFAFLRCSVTSFSDTVDSWSSPWLLEPETE